MVGPVRITGADAPGHLPEDQHKEQEEDPRHFQDEDSAHALKGAQKPPDSAGYACCCLARLSPCTVLDSRGGSNRNRSCCRVRVSTGTGQALPGHSSRNTKPRPQHSANGLRFHPVYDGSSDSEEQFDFGSCPSFVAALR